MTFQPDRARSHHLPTYHSVASDDDVSSLAVTAATLVAGILISVLVFHKLAVRYFDLPFLSISEIVWNLLVYMTPSHVIFALDQASVGPTSKADEEGSAWKSHAAKSDAMRRVLNVHGRGLFSTADGSGNILGRGKSTRAASDGRPGGLGNWDNSCYQNSVIQGLASLHALPPYLDDIIMLHSKHDKTSPSPSTPVAALKTIINNLNDPSNGGRRFWNPAALKSMSSWQQQDAQEYFSKILDEVEKDGSKAFRSALETSGFDKLSAQQPLTTVDPSQHPRNPLEGLLAQRVGCMRCGWSEGLALIPFICLTVPLGRGWDHELVDCLDEYTKLEHIEGVECTRCTMLERKRQLARLLGEASKVESGTPGEPKGISRLPEQLRTSAMERFDVVQSALEDDDFSESTMTGKCKISPKDRVTVTKSCQAVIARAPKALVVHINRSIFDEFSGVQKKNHANVRFPQILDLAPWCLGSTVAEKEDKGEGTEEWVTDPGRSMLPGGSTISPHAGPQYEIRALITHYGRHENGHYICYRQSPESKLPHGSNSDDGAKEPLISTPWWRISDDDVMMVSQETVLEQGNVFMLFYERVDRATPDDYDSRPLTSRNDPLTTVESAKDGDETARLDDKAETTLDVPAIAAIKDDTSGVEQDATLDIHSQDVPEPAKATTSEGESEHINEPTAIGGSHDHIIMEKDTEKDETDSRSTHTTGLDPRLVAAPPMWTAGPDGGEERGQEERLSSSVVMAN